MNGNRQKNEQLEFTYEMPRNGDALKPAQDRVESDKAKIPNSNHAITNRLMEEILERGNLKQALQRVLKNKGAAGTDGMKVKELPDYLKRTWPEIKGKLLSGSYHPKPVKRVEIPKPNGGLRKLGIPSVLDRFIQQAILQVLQPRWDPTFSDHSYGFRPGRSATQAIKKSQGYISEGYGYVVDLDLEKYFDTVNHDMLMHRISLRVEDKRLLRLIRSYLKSGLMQNGLFCSSGDVGVPQGGPLSPLLSNLFLDEFDEELTHRGLRFVRYADDANIYVRTPRAGLRVLANVKKYLETRMRLKVNEKKSAVDKVTKRQFLGFSFIWSRKGNPLVCLSPKTLRRFKDRIKELTRRVSARSLKQIVVDLRPYILGWKGYFGVIDTPWTLRDLDGWNPSPNQSNLLEAMEDVRPSENSP